MSYHALRRFYARLDFAKMSAKADMINRAFWSAVLWTIVIFIVANWMFGFSPYLKQILIGQ
jgi:hypothetical protein